MTRGHMRSHEVGNFGIFWNFFMWFSYLCLFNLANNSLAVGTVISFDSVRPPCETASVKQQLIRNLIHVDRSNPFDLGIAKIFSHFKYKYYHLLTHFFLSVLTIRHVFKLFRLLHCFVETHGISSKIIKIEYFIFSETAS